MLLSIIIPIYNVEKYLSRCLDSIFDQHVSEDNFEVIAVNDGSPDNCLEILKEYEQCHKNIVIIDKENGGVSSARNAGLQICKGNYVTFVDPDDYLADNSLLLLFEKMQSFTTDMIICNSISDKDGSLIYDWQDVCVDNIIYSKNSVFGVYRRGAVWGVLYNNSFLHNNQLEFPVGVRNAEDVIFFTHCLALSKSVKFEGINLYTLFRRNDSASRIINCKSIFAMKYALDYVQQLRINTIDKEIECYYEYLMYAIITSITTMTRLIPGFKIDVLLNDIAIKSYLPITPCFKDVNLKIHILNISYRLYYFLYSIKYLFRKPNFI